MVYAKGRFVAVHKEMCFGLGGDPGVKPGLIHLMLMNAEDVDADNEGVLMTETVSKPPLLRGVRFAGYRADRRLGGRPP